MWNVFIIFVNYKFPLVWYCRQLLAMPFVSRQVIKEKTILKGKYNVYYYLILIIRDNCIQLSLHLTLFGCETEMRLAPNYSLEIVYNILCLFPWRNRWSNRNFNPSFVRFLNIKETTYIKTEDKYTSAIAVTIIWNFLLA